VASIRLLKLDSTHTQQKRSAVFPRRRTCLPMAGCDSFARVSAPRSAAASASFQNAQRYFPSGAALQQETVFPPIQHDWASQIRCQNIIHDERQFFCDRHHTLWFE